ncbi:MAG: serine/threonine-protein kinase [Gemmatimonadetes bacterium]|nr:serine/threonine-protein kinase [Gemmatimonadota bacterium]MBI3567961.1 serine/threonine-protein kinase [Gemmatimonadota bacterium]
MAESPEQLAAILSDRYRVERQLGQGGMATVYLADDLKLERQVALKVLRPELGAVLGTERFLAEVKITARLDHPHILTLIDSGVAGGLLYYVLPYVRGESLRDLLDREQQLGIEQALTITKHVASALDYAHRQGVVHRDIKPENILLQEGEAMLADFGIALAVQESGGNRLTETGLSLGTPQYMSPEQATGDRDLDARSDVYSLAAVLYEMLVGDPPMQGKTVQAVIAKLLTEQPTHIRTVRPTVSEAIDAAVQKALSKVPADRFASAGDFMRALEAAPVAPVSATGAMAAAQPRPRSRALWAAGAVGAIAAVSAIVILGAKGKFGGESTSAALRDRTQLTFTGKIYSPTLSADGKQLAYFTKSCRGADCSYSVDVQDVGSTVTRHILEGVTTANGLEWSPDRRNLLIGGLVGGRAGSFIVSALGGPANFLTPGLATFYAGGDSLLLAPAFKPDSSFVVRIAGLTGAVRDSIRIPGPGIGVAALASVPGTTRIVTMVVQPPHGLWQVLDRDGKVTDKLLNSCTCGGTAAHDAIWMTRAGPTAAEAVVRVALDPNSGKLASRQDTIYSGRFTNLSVTADGTQMAVDDGSTSYSEVAGGLPELLKGAMPGGAPLMQGSTSMSGVVSPDGGRILMIRVVPGANGADELRYSVTPFGGGAETPVNVSGRARGAVWVDSVTLLTAALSPKGTRLALIDVRSGATGRSLELPDSTRVRATALPDGWAWIPKNRDRIIVEQNGQRHEIAKPAWYDALNEVRASADGSKLLFSGWGSPTSDTLRVDVVPVAGGASTRWFSSFGDHVVATWLADGAIAVQLWSRPEAVTLLKVTGPGQAQTLGTVPRPSEELSVSADLKRATLGWEEYRGDAWMYRVVKP